MQLDVLWKNKKGTAFVKPDGSDMVFNASLGSVGVHLPFSWRMLMMLDAGIVSLSDGGAALSMPDNVFAPAMSCFF